jgi:hypothetical protein
MLLHDIHRRLVERLRLHWDIERLRALDDRALADMGIARESIVSRVKGRI